MLLKQIFFKSHNHDGELNPCEGAAAVEFAIVFPFFFLLVMGIFELGAFLAVQTTMEVAVLQVSRFGRTGDIVAGQTAQQTAQSLARNYIFDLIDPEKMKLTVTPYASFADIPSRENAPNDGTQDFGTAKQPVLYTLSYEWNFFTPLIGNLLGSEGKRTIIASSIVQNEPF